MPIGLYMDQHIKKAITQQLRAQKVDVLTAQDDGMDTASDEQLLERATSLGRVVVTMDHRFRALAEDRQRRKQPFAGLVYVHGFTATLGDCVKDLLLIAQASEPKDWAGVIEHIPF